MRCLLLIGTMFLMGCSTTINDSAPSPQPGMVFVVGSKQGRPQVWLCPDRPGKGECQEVDVEVQ